MKRILLTFIAAIAITISCYSQKYAFVDTEYILENIPSYKAAQEQLDQLSKQYQKELETIQAELEQMYNDFRAESILLSDDMKRKREDVIVSKEKEYRTLQQKYFGMDGELYKKRQGLVKPIQDDIYNAVKEIASTANYAVIFDKSGSLTMLYTDPKYNLSDQVLEKLGYKK
ncbi:MAG TPA: OmpH family outer membrane protein [Prolixibacteraceae bacterium]|nr:OmpH family outer membrane protein [Prolixibacteraceae bacterium]HPS12990.1 OmpH family outer membrane protein [Prolixibacteraceae bacterium]